MATTTNQSRSEAREALHKSIRVNVSSGRWAVACIGSKQWMSEAAIGDGITSATSSLVTRCETREEAESLAEKMNDLEPGILPGQGFAWVFAAVKYSKSDYIGSQNWDRNQRRDCDRRLFFSPPKS